MSQVPSHFHGKCARGPLCLLSERMLSPCPMAWLQMHPTALGCCQPGGMNLQQRSQQPAALGTQHHAEEGTSPGVVREHAVRRDQAPLRVVVQRRVALAAPERGAAGRERIIPCDLRRVVDAAAAAVPPQALGLQVQKACMSSNAPWRFCTLNSNCRAALQTQNGAKSTSLLACLR